MTDIFISYSREDHDRVRPIAESLRAEGWKVWWDPNAPRRGANDEADLHLAAADAVLVVWSAAARASEYVRSEAASGLYKNKLIQTRIDHSAPPRPFDQLEISDLNAWLNEGDDANWRNVVEAARGLVGAPAALRRRESRQPGQSAPGGKLAYLENERTLAPGPIIVGIAVLGLVSALLIVDPLGWRAGSKAAVPAIELAGVARPTAALPEAAPVKAAVLPDTPAAEQAWSKVNRNNPAELRAFLEKNDQPTGVGETARSLLRVFDAQAWADAVVADNEKAYVSYLKKFPADGRTPGAMAKNAQERLASLAIERTQAIKDIQRGLSGLKLFKGDADGRISEATVRSVKAFTQSHKRPYVDLKSAAPRDLRGLADLANTEAAARSGGTVIATVAPAPIETTGRMIASATPRPASESAAQPAASSSAAEADRQRVEQAQAARREAEQSADERAAAVLRARDAADWSQAQATDTVSAYQTYLAVHPTGTGANDAKAAVNQKAPPAAFSVNLVPPQLRPAVETARQAEAAAQARAAAARAAAQRADEVAAQARAGASGAQVLSAASGDRFETQVADGSPNGLGVKINGDTPAKGDRYRGELRNGMGAGLGVYEFSDNPNNAQAGALRYEGEHASDRAAGLGVTYWKNGDHFAGQEAGGGAGRGVLSFANGQRYDGEIVNGKRNGLGVVWSPDGQVVFAGRWENGVLVEPSAPPVAPSP